MTKTTFSAKQSKHMVPIVGVQVHQYFRQQAQSSNSHLSRYLVAIALQTGRTARQCSERWRLSIDPDIRRGKFTPDEDEALIKAVETHGSSWAKIREMVVGRTAAQCRERWVNHLDPNVKHSAPWTPEVRKPLLPFRYSVLVVNKVFLISRRIRFYLRYELHDQICLGQVLPKKLQDEPIIR